MGTDLLESLNGVFGNPIIRQVSAFFGESEANTGSALRAGGTSLLASLVHKTAQGGAGDLFRQLSSSAVDAQLPSRVASLVGSRGSFDSALATGEGAATSVLGNRMGGVTHAIAKVTGVKPSSAAGLLAMAAPMLLSLLKGQVAHGSLDARGLASLLTNQRSSLMKAGLDNRITDAMGFGSLHNMLAPADETVRRDAELTAEPRHETASAHTPPRQERTRRPTWVPWAIGAAIVAAVAAVLFGARTLRNDRVASLPAEVYFDSGQANVDAEDRTVIVAVVNATRASDAPVLVTGFTARTGDPDRNAALAQNRAAAVRAALVAEGIPETRVFVVPPTPVAGSDRPQDAQRVRITLSTADTPARR